MRRHVALIHALKEYAIAVDIAKKKGDMNEQQSLRAKMIEADFEYKDLSTAIQVQITSRLVTPRGGDTVFEIKEYIMNTGEIVIRQLFDSNRILLKHTNTHSAMFRKLTPESFFRDYDFMQKEMSNFHHHELNRGDNTFKVIYSISGTGSNKFTMVEEILPKRLAQLGDWQQVYDLKFNPETKVINAVVNRFMGPV